MLTRRQLLGTIAVSGVQTSRGIAVGYGLKIFPREEWAIDRPQLGSPDTEDVRFLLVHHSASTNSYSEADVPAILRSFYDLHTGSAKGWDDIAYNFLIDRFGQVWEGRDGSIEGPVAADATGGNQGFSQLACLIGDYTIEMPTQAALDSLRGVLAWLADRYLIDTAPGATVRFTSRGSNRWDAGIEVLTPTIAGHRDMSMTACPGDALYPYVLDELAADLEAIREQVRPAPTTRPTTTTSPQPATTVIPVVTTGAPATTGEGMSTRSRTADPPRAGTVWFRGAAATGLIGLLAVLFRRISNASLRPDGSDRS